MRTGTAISSALTLTLTNIYTNVFAVGLADEALEGFESSAIQDTQNTRQLYVLGTFDPPKRAQRLRNCRNPRK